MAGRAEAPLMNCGPKCCRRAPHSQQTTAFSVYKRPERLCTLGHAYGQRLISANMKSCWRGQAEIAAEIARVQGLAPDELRRTWRITAAAEGASSVNLIELKPAEPHHAVGRGHAHLA
jgi:hypothetical protein